MSTALIVAAPGHAEGADPAACRTTAEQCNLKAASSAARAYALTDAGVAILIYEGHDIPNPRVRTSEQLGNYFVRKFSEHNTEARYFITPNKGTNTAMRFMYGNATIGSGDGTEIRNVDQAVGSIGRIAEIFWLHQQFKDVPDEALPDLR